MSKSLQHKLTDTNLSSAKLNTVQYRRLMNQMEKSAAANAVGGKTARACDSCLRRRARWYCAADDAFLCQACDSSVHAANPLARRHDRVRLKTASLSNLSPPTDLNPAVPAWHKRKARTPRHAKASAEAVSKPPVLLVPDLEAENFDDDEAEEEQLIYRVPIFDPVLEEFCPPATEEVKLEANVNQIPHVFNELYQSELELAEFSANVENLLGQDLDNDSFCIDGLGLLETKDDDDKNQVKMEITDAVDSSCGNFLVDMEMELSRESLDFNFDCGSTGEEAEEQKVEAVEDQSGLMKVGLRLDYDAVIDAWSCRGCSPWTDGERPQFNPDDCWPDFTIPNVYGGTEGGLYGRVGNSDGGREARVSRYREKRRTRLFSKKIRYEVRKLNAEKRPRMKGRFVKRASFNSAGGGGSAAFPYV